MSERTNDDAAQPVLRVIPMPSDTNATGSIFGGWLMSQADLAGSVVAMQRARGPVVTVAVNTFQFYKPVLVGDIVTFEGAVSRVGTTSIAVAITIFASHVSPTDRSRKVAEATITYVAVDENHQKRPVPAE